MKTKFLITLATTFLLLFMVGSTVVTLPEENVEENIARVALVNEDTGFTNELTTYTFGTTFIREYANNSSNNVTITTRADALKQIEDGKYDLVIIIPQNFSKDIMTFDSKVPTTSNIEYYINPNSTKVDYLSNVLQKDNVETEINNMVSASFVVEIIDKVYEIKNNNEVVLEMHEDYLENYDDNIVNPYEEAFSEIVSILSSVETQQLFVEVQADAVSSYSTSVEGSQENIIELDSNLSDFYNNISEDKLLLEDSNTGVNSLDKNLSAFNIYFSHNETTGEEDTLSASITSLGNNITEFENSTIVGQTRKEVLTNLEAEMRNYPVNSLDEIRTSILSNQSDGTYINYANAVIDTLKTIESNFRENRMYDNTITQLSSNCKSYATEENGGKSNVVKLCTSIGFEPTGSNVNSEVTIISLIKILFDKDVNGTLSALPASCTIDTPCSMGSNNVYTLTTFSGSIREDLKTTYFSIISDLKDTIDLTSSFDEQINDLKEDYESLRGVEIYIDDYASANTEIMFTTRESFDPFYTNFVGYNDVTVSLSEEQQQVINIMNGLLDKTTAHITSTEELSKSGSDMLKTTSDSKVIVDNNKEKVADARADYDEMVGLNTEFVDEYSEAFSDAKNGAVHNEKFYNNIASPVIFVDNGYLFNFGSVVPFFIMLIFAIFSIIVAFIYKKWTPKVQSKTEHSDVSKYKVNLKQWLFVVFTGVIVSLIIAYISINVLSLTPAMVAKFAVAIIFIGISITLLFYVLIYNLKIYGVMIVGTMIIIYFVTSGALDVSVDSTIISMLAKINPLTYFEVILRDIVYGREINTILLTLVVMLIIGSSTALMMINSDLIKRVENESVY